MYVVVWYTVDDNYDKNDGGFEFFVEVDDAKRFANSKDYASLSQLVSMPITLDSYYD